VSARRGLLSDATLNRGGVRLGTAEFYAVVQELAEVDEALVVHLEDVAGGPGELLLFAQLAPVKRILAGADPDAVTSRGSLRNPDALRAFVEFAGRRQAA